MKRAIIRAFHLVVRTKLQKSRPRMELFSRIKMNSWEKLAMNSTINCNILGATDVPEPYSYPREASPGAADPRVVAH